jgi:nicotinamide mononucleotide transporter
METLNWLFSIETIVAVVFDYPLSLVELLGTTFGMWSVLLAARARVWNYPIGMLNSVFFFASFYQVQLYADMFLQIYFVFMSLYGWWHWVYPGVTQRTSAGDLSMTRAGWGFLGRMSAVIAASAVGFGFLLQQIHILLPTYFPMPAAFPFWDALVMVLSIAAMYLLARKIWETWVLWILVDCISIVLFWVKGLQLISLEYGVFLGIASYGCWWWSRQIKVVQVNA